MKSDPRPTESQDLIVFGRHPVEEILSRDPARVSKVFLRQGLQGAIVQRVRDLASKHSIQVQVVPEAKIRALTGRGNDQGVAAAIAPLAYTEPETWAADALPQPPPPHGHPGTQPLSVLILDEIEDPHNTGAILRSAAACGMSAVFVGSERQAPLNAAVMKASAGTAGTIPVVRCRSAAEGADFLRRHGFWITGLDAKSEVSLWEMDLAEGNMAFVIGNEGRGMRRKTGEACDFLARIPMRHGIESLNASVSAAVLGYEWARQKQSLAAGRSPLPDQ
jgi:23S rRNA (guanosine2251-2'-O)-methyltransferase